MIHYLMIFHGIISVLLIITVLLQFGRGAEAGFLSGGATEAVFSGAQRGNILSKITMVMAILFLGNSLLLAKLESNQSSQSILDNTTIPVQTEAPAAAPAPVTTEPAPAEKK